MLFSLTVYTKSENIRTIPYCGYNWFYNENSASNTLNKGFNLNLDIKNVLDKIAAIIPKDFSETKLIKFFIKNLLFIGYWTVGDILQVQSFYVNIKKLMIGSG